MKRLIVGVLVGLSLSGAASAGAYSDAVDKQLRCDGYGEDAKRYYEYTPAEKKSSAQIYGDHIHIMETYHEKLNKAQRDRLLTSRIVVYATTQAKSAKDAQMTAWGWCMDYYSKWPL